MMTRRNPRRDLPRTSHTPGTKRPPIWYNSLHHIRNFLFYWLFLSLLPFKPCSHSRVRGMLTPRRHHPPGPIWCAAPKYSCPTRLRRYSDLNTPQHHGGGTQTSRPFPCPHNPIRILLHTSASNRVLRSTVYNRRWGIRRHLLCSDRLSRPTCHYWLFFPNRLPPPTNSISLYIGAPLWV